MLMTFTNLLNRATAGSAQAAFAARKKLKSMLLHLMALMQTARMLLLHP